MTTFLLTHSQPKTSVGIFRKSTIVWQRQSAVGTGLTLIRTQKSVKMQKKHKKLAVNELKKI